MSDLELAVFIFVVFVILCIKGAIKTFKRAPIVAILMDNNKEELHLYKVLQYIQFYPYHKR